MGNNASLGEQLSKSKYKSAPKIIISDYQGTKDGKLSALPAQIGGLRSCVHFDASENVIAKLPKEIGKMARLKVLDLHMNKLTELPEEIGHLLTLEELYLDNNRSEERRVGKKSRS